MDTFLSCDWGTSSFRLRLVEVKSFKILAEIKNDSGILETFTAWQQNEPATNRVLFYTSIITNHIRILSEKLRVSLKGIPVVLSGMASSTIGLIDLPYKVLPFEIDGSDLHIEMYKSDETTNPLIIVSGARTENDVMRGEETKIVGCAQLIGNDESEQLFVLPGTHPKHVLIKDRRIIGFKTFMTGEFFDLLSTKSILSGSIAAGEDLNSRANQKSFMEAVQLSQTTNLLHHSFLVRTNQVLERLSKQQNYYYLSGLLIGAELASLESKKSIYLLGGPAHRSLYTLACSTLGIDIIQSWDADQALIQGQATIFSRMKDSSSLLA